MRNQQLSTLTLYLDHKLVKSRVKVQRLEIKDVIKGRIKVEILNIYNNTRRAKLLVGENPLNRNGNLLEIG